MEKMKFDELKKNAADWIKTHPTHTKVILIAVLVVVFCIIFVSCKNKNTQKKPQKPPVQQNQPVTPQPAPAPTPEPTPVVSESDAESMTNFDLGNGVELTLVPVSKGSFSYGSPKSEKGRYSNENLRKVSTKDDFYIGTYEVTQAQYAAVTGQNPSKFKGDSLPVENVTWDNAVMFCEKLNAGGHAPAGWKFALPTSQQWEYACRAGTTTPFSFGSVLNGDKANCYGSAPYGTTTKGAYLKKTQPVGSYAANDWGIYDMHGNVWEWCQNTVKGKRTYEIRGGSWATAAKDCRSATRSVQKPSKPDYRTGFRVVLVRAD